MKKLVNTFLLLWACTAIGQIEFDKLVPPNPDVAALMNINYHSGGIQVSEEASRVGLGWSLQAGGTIYRTVKGLPDFGEHISNHQPYIENFQTTVERPDHEEITRNGESFFSPAHNSYIRSNEDCELLVDGVPTDFQEQYQNSIRPDYLADSFTYSFNGYSGSFILKPNGEIFQLEKNGLIIEYEPTSGAYDFNYNFKFITEDGTQYLFQDWAKTNTNLFVLDAIYTSSWFLSKIITPNGREVVFNYDQVGSASNLYSGLSNVYPLRTFIQYLAIPGRRFEEHVGPQVAVEDVYLTSIEFTDGRVDFSYSEEGERLFWKR